MTDYTVPAIIVIAITALILLAMWLGWRGRSRRDVQVGAYPLPASVAAPIVGADGFYVATTQHEKPLERLNIRSLGFRAKARVTAGADGVALEIPGEETAWIPREAMHGAGPATFAIDRVVERDGLVCITWALAGSGDLADSYLRISDSSDRERVLDALAHILSSAPAEATEESEA
ncbi:hypothetical protein [Orlajensenia leifsoniae]|uniref:PH domain-containing protein n=1 Tax=Orlajensenia leifsoniae TaxID=2561933 RepID=A0A4Y9R4W6_9MICO|nr:hypothetical protein [Leifsonia flava]TFV98962.1 hypothetical protein E4M00_05560 [Leifsonia flava]